MKKISVVLIAATMVLLLPRPAGAAPGRPIGFLLEGGKAWGEALSGPLVSGKVLLPLARGLWFQAGYSHFFSPVMWGDPSGNRRSALAFGLQFMGQERGKRLRWFVHGDGASFRTRLENGPGAVVHEFGLGLGAGLEKPLSERLGLRLDMRAWSLCSAHVGFLSDDAWVETSLGIQARL